ncbi:MAG: hypothetical protein ACYDCC_07455 [Actinomycetota bacterium]
MKAATKPRSSLSIAATFVVACLVVMPDPAPAAGIQLLPHPIEVSVSRMMQLSATPLMHAPRNMKPGFMDLLADDTPGTKSASTPLSSDGGRAPGSHVAIGGANGFPGIDLVTQERSGTGNYAGTGQGLEPPDQALCVGDGYVIEGVNQAFQMFSNRSVPLTPAIPLAQFFGQLPNATGGPTSFLSDPKCVYDARTKRFFATSLEIDEANVGVFTRAHNLIAVSESPDPTKNWRVYSIDVTDDGQMGTPLHPTCPCLGDQPLIGLDANGFYMSTNEYSDSEVLPVQPPPIVNGAINQVFMLPDFRNGQAQVYAIPKGELIQGGTASVVRIDTATIPLPAGAPTGATWSSLQPAFQPPGDRTQLPRSGVEYFMSQLDFATTGDNRVAVWALQNTRSLDSVPNLTLTNTLITTRGAQTYAAPQSADQKIGPLTLGAKCTPTPCAEEKLNANDDRMNQVMLTNGRLWSGVNTLLPPITPGSSGQGGDPRTGIMYFDVAPSVAGGTLSAKMVRDGYVNVPRENVLFPSIGASPRGTVIMSFTLSGIDYFPSSAWTRLDNVSSGAGPVVHIAAKGAEPEDGFTGYCAQGILSNIQGQCTNGVARWGDYSASAVDETGCVWSGTEYISGARRDPNAGNWSTFVTRIPTPGCATPAFLKPKGLNLACEPLFVGTTGSDNFAGTGEFKGQNPQMNILRGSMRVSRDGKTLTTTLTINDLSKTIASPGGGLGNVYYMNWSFNGVSYYTKAEVNSAGAVTYTDGTSTNGDRTTGPADTGSFNLGKNGTVIVNVPLDQVGSPARGNTLSAPEGETRGDETVMGTGLAPLYDAAGPMNNYVIGQTCQSSKKKAH